MAKKAKGTFLAFQKWRIQSIDWKAKALITLLGSYLVLVPSFSLLPLLSPFNEKRTLQVCILLLTGGGVVVSTDLRRHWIVGFQALPRLAKWGLGAVLGLGLVSSVRSPGPFYAFLEVGHYVALFVTAGVIAVVVRRTSPSIIRKLFLGVVVVGVLLYAVPFTVAYGMQLTMEDIKLWPWGWTNFANYRFFNQYQTWTLPLLVGTVLIIPRQRYYLKGVVFASAVFWGTLIFASEAEGTVVAIGVATLGVLLLFRKGVWRWVVLLLLAATIGWIGYKVLFSVPTGGGGGSSFGQQLTGDSSYGRLEHWAVCLNMFQANPLFGAGPMHFAWPVYQFTEPASPHSAFFQWLAEWGGVSTGIMSGLTVWGGWKWMEYEKTSFDSAEESGSLNIALVASILAAAAHAQVSGIILHPLSQMLFVFIGGWAWGRYQRGHPPSDKESSAWAHLAFCALLIPTMAVVGSGLKDLATMEERRAAYKEVTDRRYYAPRYWQQGYIGLRDSSVVKRLKQKR